MDLHHHHRQSFYPPLNIETIFNRNLNDKVMQRFGFLPTTSTSIPANFLNVNANNFQMEPRTFTNSHPHLAKSFSQDMNTNMANGGALLNANTFFSNPNLFRSPTGLVAPPPSQAPPPPPPPSAQFLAPPHHPKFTNQSFTHFPTNNQMVVAAPVIDNSSASIIRKLGQNEKIFHGSMNNNASYIFRAAIVTSEIDLYKHMHVLHEAIEQWKMAHPLLRSRVLTRLPNQYPNMNSQRVEKYFALATDQKLNSMDNVKFLYYNSHSPSTCDDIWKLLVEKETTQPMDGENGLLWRLTFFQVSFKFFIESIGKTYPKY